MKNSYSILVCGIGGQGVTLLSRILASSAERVYPNVCRLETRGLSQRGGTVGAEVRFGHGPLAPGGGSLRADYILSLDALEALRAWPRLKDKGTLISNSHFLPPGHLLVQWRLSGHIRREMMDFKNGVLTSLMAGKSSVRMADLNAVAREARCEKALNVAMLGFAVQQLPIPFTQIKEEMMNMVKSKFRDANARVFELGLAAGKEQEMATQAA